VKRDREHRQQTEAGKQSNAEPVKDSAAAATAVPPSTVPATTTVPVTVVAVQGQVASQPGIQVPAGAAGSAHPVIPGTTVPTVMSASAANVTLPAASDVLTAHPPAAAISGQSLPVPVAAVAPNAVTLHAAATPTPATVVGVTPSAPNASPPVAAPSPAPLSSVNVPGATPATGNEGFFFFYKTVFLTALKNFFNSFNPS
jgi:S-DNA-T family DNA segregation ATPase FtsK/SpoIIIE